MHSSFRAAGHGGSVPPRSTGRSHRLRISRLLEVQVDNTIALIRHVHDGRAPEPIERVRLIDNAERRRNPVLNVCCEIARAASVASTRRGIRLCRSVCRHDATWPFRKTPGRGERMDRVQYEPELQIRPPLELTRQYHGVSGLRSAAPPAFDASAGGSRGVIA